MIVSLVRCPLLDRDRLSTHQEKEKFFAFGRRPRRAPLRRSIRRAPMQRSAIAEGAADVVLPQLTDVELTAMELTAVEQPPMEFTASELTAVELL